MNPLFSIILTTYNRSNFLPRAIRSVLRQTFTNFELLIVDDHSTDNTKQVVTDFTDNRITYIQQTHNQGISIARNTGIQHAKGEYLCFLDDDDEYFPEILAEINSFVKNKEQPFIGFIRVGIANVFTAGNLATGKSRIKTKIWNLDKEKDLVFITEMAYVGLVYHRRCFEHATFNPELNFAEDLDLVLQLLTLGLEYASIPKVLIRIHIHEQPSLSRSITSIAKIKSLQLFLFTHDKFINKQLCLWLYYYTKLCGDYYRLGKKHLARRLVRSILKKCWYHPKLWEIFLKFELRMLNSKVLQLFSV